MIENCNSLLDAQYQTVTCKADIDKLYELIVSNLHAISRLCFRKPVFKPFLKPYWNDDLSKHHSLMKNFRSDWVNSGRQSNYTFLSYKNAKREFRRLHRQSVEKYLSELDSEINRCAEVNQSDFWNLIRSRRHKVGAIGSEIKFGEVIYRDPQDITEQWKKYFSSLYTPANCADYDADWKRFVDSKVSSIINSFQSDVYKYRITPEDVETALKTCKLGKAPGIDFIYYEHLIYGGVIFRNILARLFTAMLNLGHIPSEMNKGVIITLHKGGRKSRCDPNNYRAISLTPTILKLYETVLISIIQPRIHSVLSNQQGGFQKQLGCVMTSFTLKEIILYANENNSRAYVFFLDARQAFDRVWHNGLMYKLSCTGIEPAVLRALMCMYKNITSCVRHRQHISPWFNVLQGTRQGGKSSPLLYLLFINGLIKELEESNLGFCLYNMNVCSPTVADDMVLVSLTKAGLDGLLAICHRYAMKWRFEYNVSKCAVIVFNESVADFSKSSRQWHLGDKVLSECTKYTHLGIECNKYHNIRESLDQAANKLRGTFLNIINSGLYPGGLSPPTLLKLYTSVVLPKGLYGCQLWSNLNNTNITVVERAHKFCIKRMQKLPAFCSTDFAISSIGATSISVVIEYHKLTFLGQLCRLPSQYISKQIFLHRLIRYLNCQERQDFAFVPDVCDILEKTDLMHIIYTFVKTAKFPSKSTWKRIIKSKLFNKDYQNRMNRMSQITGINYHTLSEMFLPDRGCKIWDTRFWGRTNVAGLSSTSGKTNAVNVLCRLFSWNSIKACIDCGICCDNIIVHKLHFCPNYMNQRIQIWSIMFSKCGPQAYSAWCKTTPKQQIFHLLTGMSEFCSDETSRFILGKILRILNSIFCSEFISH